MDEAARRQDQILAGRAASAAESAQVAEFLARGRAAQAAVDAVIATAADPPRLVCWYCDAAAPEFCAAIPGEACQYYSPAP